MYYSETYTTKWHDTDACGVMRPSRLLEYMQETANHQCRAYGMDLNDLFFDEGLGFLLSRIMIRIDAPLRAYEDIEVRTWCPPSRGLTFARCFSVLRGKEVVAEASSTWALADVKNKKLIKVSDFRREFPDGDPIDPTTLPRQVRIPASREMEVVGERRIVYSDLDFNRHMNNTKYPDMICDFLPDMQGKWVKGMSLFYMNEATFGDVVTVQRVAEDDRPDAYLLRTVRGDGTVCLEAEMELAEIETV